MTFISGCLSLSLGEFLFIWFRGSYVSVEIVVGLLLSEFGSSPVEELEGESPSFVQEIEDDKDPDENES